MHRLLHVLSHLVFAALLFSSVTAFAQDSRPSPQGVDLAAFSAEVRQAAAAAGATAPSDDELAAAFRAGDSNGDGVIDGREQSASERQPSCSDRGVCVRGRCFCLAGHSAPTQQRGVGTDNPIFVDPTPPMQNQLSND
jgi:hypothetical protein